MSNVLRCAALCCAPPSFPRLRPRRFGLQVGAALLLAVAVAVAGLLAASHSLRGVAQCACDLGAWCVCTQSGL